MEWYWPHEPGKPNVEATAAPPDSSIRVQFDRFLAPDTANRQGVCVQTSSPTAGTDQCLTAGSGPGAVTFAVEYDPVDRVVVLKHAQALLPLTRYNVRLIPPKNDTDETGIRAFDGVPLAKEVDFAFTTGDAAAKAVEPKRAVDYCTAVDRGCHLPSDACTVKSETNVGSSVSDYVGTNCTGDSSCHNGSVTGAKVRLGEALIFDDGPDKGGVPGALVRIAKQRLVAPETATDPDPGAPRTSGQDAFGRNMPYIDPKNPGNSYILYKMIIGMLRCPAGNNDAILPESMNCAVDGGYQGSATTVQSGIEFYKCSDVPDAQAPPADGGACSPLDPTTLPPPQYSAGTFVPYLVEPWVPDTEWKSPVAGEYDRLKYRIRGDPMPSPSGAEGPQNLHMISAWITAGAPAKTCP